MSGELFGPNGNVIPTIHLTQRLAERGRDMQDVLKVLETGRIREGRNNPRYDRNHSAWTCRLEGSDTEGRNFSVVIGLVDRGSISLITAYAGRRKKT